MREINVVRGIDDVRAATERLLQAADALDDDAVTAPSLRPGWTVGHVLTHVCRNADGNRRMLDGAMRREVLDQYPGGREGRAADIEAGASRSAALVRDDLRLSSVALAETITQMTPDAWDRPVRPLGGEAPAWRTLLSRRREVEVHHVDLGLAYRPTDWPSDFVVDELVAAGQRLSERLPPGTVLRLKATDTEQHLEAMGRPAGEQGRPAEEGGRPAREGPVQTGEGPGGPGDGYSAAALVSHPIIVSGLGLWLLAWLIGRRVPTAALDAPAGLPALGAWSG